MNQTRKLSIRSRESDITEQIDTQSASQNMSQNTSNNNKYIIPIERAIMFITFYGLVDYVEEIVNEFESVCTEDQNNKYTYSVHWYPYLKYVNDLNMNTEKMSAHLIQTIREKHITHIFWIFLPETVTFYEALHRDAPDVKFIFYNFDDLKNFNINNLSIAEQMDYFIQPTQINQQKYSLVLKNIVFYIPHYVHVDLVCLTDLDESSSELYGQYAGVDTEIDCTIIVEDAYENYDVIERNTLHRYIDTIKNTMIDHNHTFKLYGDIALENIYPDMYEDELNTLNEGICYINTKCVIILDVTDGINKDFSRKIIHASLNNKKIFTNSFGMNRYVRKFIPESASQILDMTDMKPLVQYIDAIKQGVGADDSHEIGQDCKQNVRKHTDSVKQDNQKHTIKNWVNNILQLISID